MAFLEKLRKRWAARRRRHEEEAEEELEAEARGETYTLRGSKEAVRDERSENDFPSRGGGVVGR